MPRFEFAWTATFNDGGQNDGVYSGDHETVEDAFKAAREYAARESHHKEQQMIHFTVPTPGGGFSHQWNPADNHSDKWIDR